MAEIFTTSRRCGSWACDTIPRAPIRVNMLDGRGYTIRMLRFRLYCCSAARGPWRARPLRSQDLPNTDKLYQVAMAEFKAGRYDKRPRHSKAHARSARPRSTAAAWRFLLPGAIQNKRGRICSPPGRTTPDRRLPQTHSWMMHLISRARLSAEWRHPELDATYGNNALTGVSSLLASYPDSPFAEPAKKRSPARTNGWPRRIKHRISVPERKAFDSAILYSRT